MRGRGVAVGLVVLATCASINSDPSVTTTAPEAPTTAPELTTTVTEATTTTMTTVAEEEATTTTTEVVPEVAPEPEPVYVPTPTTIVKVFTSQVGPSVAGGDLASIRACESGSDYSTNTGNGYYGAYQFTLSTWASVGGSGYPHQASAYEQDMRAQMMIDSGRRGEWPNC